LRRYILKEYGSWGVMLISYLTGLSVTARSDIKSFAALAAISLYVNSKQALTLWVRGTEPGRSKPLVLFIAQIALASALLAYLLGDAILKFLPYGILPLAYISLTRLAGEHAMISEISGFVLLTSSVLVSKFVVSGDIDPRLYIATAVFFTAGVFKVRVQLKKRTFERVLMGLYLIFALILYRVIRLPLIVLLPLLDDVIFAVTLYRVKLRAMGWIEVLKGIAFLVLITFSY
jgi:hypothetical protein